MRSHVGQYATTSKRSQKAAAGFLGLPGKKEAVDGKAAINSDLTIMARSYFLILTQSINKTRPQSKHPPHIVVRHPCEPVATVVCIANRSVAYTNLIAHALRYFRLLCCRLAEAVPVECSPNANETFGGQRRAGYSPPGHRGRD